MVILTLAECVLFYLYNPRCISSPPFFLMPMGLFVILSIQQRAIIFKLSIMRASFMPIILSMFYLFLFFNQNNQNYWGFAAFYKKDRAPVLLIGLLLQWSFMPQILNLIICLLRRVGYLFADKKNTALIMLVFFISCLIFRDHAISKDGLDWINTTEKNEWWIFFREIYSMLFLRLSFLFFKLFGYDAKMSIAIISGISGVIFFTMSFKTLKYLFMNYMHTRESTDNFGSSKLNDKNDIYPIFIITLFSVYGISQMFFGRIEVYSLFLCAISILIFMCFKYMRTGKPDIIYIGIFYALCLGIHIASIWLLPSLVLMPWLRDKSEDKHLAEKASYIELLKNFIASLIFGAILLFPIIYFYYDFSILELFNAAFLSVTDTPDKKVFLSMNIIFSREHLTDIINLSFYNFPIVLFFALNYFINRKVKIVYGRTDIFILSSLIPATFYYLTYRLGRGVIEDWDSFAIFTYLFAFYVIFRHCIAIKKEQESIYFYDSISILLFFFSITIFQILQSCFNPFL